MRLATALLVALLALPASALLASAAPEATTVSCAPNKIGNRLIVTPCSVSATVTQSILVRVAFSRESEGVALVQARGPDQTPAESLHVACLATHGASSCLAPVSIFPATPGRWTFTIAPAVTSAEGAPAVRLDVTVT